MAPPSASEASTSDLKVGWKVLDSMMHTGGDLTHY